ncbi:hypothetical protein AWM75_06350 [Aerococcus urinaehominis]|uniref:Uncharacterized protein n=1 Tax=Aerococcus urinaehominis TaxID=128944 RepID=A0A109RGT6_9LACT|nr:adaptor protein MecA [Aerococcus urinaehominis]AMB99626.1 hypothetical protein AWM75_06350 [Aerococcus urinaehominis]SDL87897.1 adapter protein MecA 1/2 [Aerococcus urinaehominis]
MEMEYINENTIKVFIDANDLLEHNISFIDIMQNQSSVENFFMNILEEVDVSKKFQHSDAITFQVMPKNNGIDLYISKSDADREAKGMETLHTMLEAVSQEEDKPEKTVEATLPIIEDTYLVKIVLGFDHFDQVLEFAQVLDLEAANDLYLLNNKYYLLVSFDRSEYMTNEIYDAIYRLLEFTQISPINLAVLAEHGKKLIADNACLFLKNKFS